MSYTLFSFYPKSVIRKSFLSFFNDRFGFIVHCDEKNCHIHATITPILEDGRLSAKDMFGGSSLVAARAKMREWHDWYAAVNEKWGLERGDNIHVTGAKHRNLDEYHRELKCEIREMERTKAKEQTLLESIKADVKTATTRKEGLISMITNLENRQKDASGKLSSLEERLAAGLGNKEKILAQIELCKASLSKYEADLSLSLQKNATQSHKLQNNQGKSMIAEDSFVPLL